MVPDRPGRLPAVQGFTWETARCISVFASCPLSPYSGFLPLSKDMHLGDRRFGDPKLTLAVAGCLSLGFGPPTSWRLVQGLGLATPPLTQRQLGCAPAPQKPCLGGRDDG